MTDNKNALRKVKNALRDLVLVKHNDRPKTPAQISEIDRSVDKLNDEFLRLRGLSEGASYSDIAANIADAKADLDEIVEDRKQLEDALVSASKLLGSIRSVLSLIA